MASPAMKHCGHACPAISVHVQVPRPEDRTCQMSRQGREGQPQCSMELLPTICRASKHGPVQVADPIWSPVHYDQLRSSSHSSRSTSVDVTWQHSRSPCTAPDSSSAPTSQCSSLSRCFKSEALPEALRAESSAPPQCNKHARKSQTAHARPSADLTRQEARALQQSLQCTHHAQSAQQGSAAMSTGSSAACSMQSDSMPSPGDSSTTLRHAQQSARPTVSAPGSTAGAQASGSSTSQRAASQHAACLSPGTCTDPRPAVVTTRAPDRSSNPSSQPRAQHSRSMAPSDGCTRQSPSAPAKAGWQRAAAALRSLSLNGTLGP